MEKEIDTHEDIWLVLQDVISFLDQITQINCNSKSFLFSQKKKIFFFFFFFVFFSMQPYNYVMHNVRHQSQRIFFLTVEEKNLLCEWGENYKHGMDGF